MSISREAAMLVCVKVTAAAGGCGGVGGDGDGRGP